MTMAEARLSKEKLEEEIAQAICRFHAETGCCVDAVAVDLSATIDNPPEGIYRVKAEVRL